MVKTGSSENLPDRPVSSSASLPPGPSDGPPSKLAPRILPSLDRQGGLSVDRDKPGGAAILSVSHRESRFRIRYNDVAVVD
jgi:hypothetical protein